MARLFVRNLTVLDFAYLHATRGLLGESLRVHVELGGPLDAQGMVWDFARVKRDIKATLDEAFDHCLLVPAQHHGLALESVRDQLGLRFPLVSGAVIRHQSPERAVTLVDAPEITPDTLAAAATVRLREILPANVEEVSLSLQPERTDEAYFHYAHGLKHHDGNCQRIAHGHRSRIELYRGGERDRALEAEWAERWRDIYIATRADVVAEDTASLRFGYRAAQGDFALELPRDRCYLVASDSTIENIAQHVADETARSHPGTKIEARVFEGIDKGGVGVALRAPG